MMADFAIIYSIFWHDGRSCQMIGELHVYDRHESSGDAFVSLGMDAQGW